MGAKSSTLYLYLLISGLFVLSQDFLYCAQANTVVATINVGVTPAGLAITPNSLYAYVANNNNYEIAGSDSVSVLNLSNNTLQQTILEHSVTSTTFTQPYTVTINAAGTLAYVTDSNSSTVTIINIATNTVSGTITGFDGPSGFVINPANPSIAYVNNYGGPDGVGSGFGNTVRVVNLNTNTVVGPSIIVGQAPAAMAISPNGAYLYVANYVDGNTGTGTISVVQTSNNTVVDTITGFSGPFAIAVTPDGKYAYVTNFGSNNFMPYGTTVSVVNLSTNTISATVVDLGIQPAGLAITPDQQYAYVTNYDTLYTDSNFSSLVPGQGTVNIIDIATNTVVPPTIAVGQSPANIAISPNGFFAYVTNFTSNVVNVIALPTFQITAQGCKMQNRYLTQIDNVNKISWSATGFSLPVYYSIYRDADLTQLAGTVLASQPFVFYDHNTNPNTTYTYYVVGTNIAGTSSAPVAVTVSQNC